MHTPTLQTLVTPVATMLAALLTACGSEAGPTAENAPVLPVASHVAEHSTSTVPEDALALNPCNGETVHFTGTITQQTTVVSVDGGALHIELTERLSATGIGLTSGVAYRVTAGDGMTFNSPSGDALNATLTGRDRFHFQAETPGLSFTGASFIHVLALPNGELKITRQTDTSDGVCLG